MALVAGYAREHVQLMVLHSSVRSAAAQSINSSISSGELHERTANALFGHGRGGSRIQRENYQSERSLETLMPTNAVTIRREHRGAAGLAVALDMSSYLNDESSTRMLDADPRASLVEHVKLKNSNSLTTENVILDPRKELEATTENSGMLEDIVTKKQKEQISAQINPPIMR